MIVFRFPYGDEVYIYAEYCLCEKICYSVSYLYSYHRTRFWYTKKWKYIDYRVETPSRYDDPSVGHGAK